MTSMKNNRFCDLSWTIFMFCIELTPTSISYLKTELKAYIFMYTIHNNTWNRQMFSIACCSYIQQFVLYIHSHIFYVNCKLWTLNMCTHMHTCVHVIHKTSGFCSISCVSTDCYLFIAISCLIFGSVHMYNANPCETVAFWYIKCSFLFCYSSKRVPQVEIYVLADDCAEENDKWLEWNYCMYFAVHFFFLLLSFHPLMIVSCGNVGGSWKLESIRNMYECVEN